MNNIDFNHPIMHEPIGFMDKSIDKANKVKLAEILRNIMKAIKILWGTAPILLLLIGVIFLLEALIPILNLYLSKLIIDMLVEIIQNKTNSATGYILVICQAAISLVLVLLTIFQNLINMRLGQKVSSMLQERIIRKANKLPLVFFDIPESYNQLERAASGGDKCLELILNFFGLLKNAITIIGYITILLSFSWFLPLSLLISVVPPLCITVWMGKKKYHLMRFQTPFLRKVEYLFYILRARDTAKELRVFGHGKYLLRYWKNLYWKNANEQYQLEKKASLASFSTNSIRDLFSILFIAFIFWLATNGKLTLGEYFILTQAITFSLGLLTMMSIISGQMHTNSMYISDYFTFMSLEEESDVGEKLQWGSDQAFNSILKAEGITFHYPNHSKEVIKDVSFEIKQGEKIAIVGHNGAGKSTLIKCLMGLYTVTDGAVYYKDINFSNLDKAAVRNNISAIFQDFVHYQLTVRENIGISQMDKLDKTDCIRSAAQVAGAHELIESLANGYDTELGTAFTGGQELSGGQWQKIGLSRAVLKDAEIIIFDEPTAALDPIAEAKILEKFLEVTKDKTSIFITHRLGSCKQVDRILVLNEGMLVEVGTHDELMRQNGYYAEMYRSQAQWYTDEVLESVS